MGSNAPSARIHMSGALRTRSFFSLKETRFQTLLPMYFSLIRTWWTRAAGPGRPRSVSMPRSFKRSAISRSTASPRRTRGRSSGRSRFPRSGPGTRMTRSVWMLLCSPRASSPLGDPALIDEQAPQAVAGRPALAVAEFDQAALAGENLGRELPAVFAGHRALDALDDGRDRAAVVLELLGAVLDGDAGALADVLVVGALVGILESAPAADVVDEDGREIGFPALHVLDQPLQGVAAIESQAALALVRIGADDLEAAPLGVLADGVGLVLGGVFLMLRRHADVLGCPT